MSTSNGVERVRTVSGPGVPVRGNDIDTDRVIPARFMKEVTFENMGRYAFYDARRNDAGSLNDHPFNRFTDGRILLVNQNFGCGSSREHAPQALMRWGVEGIVGESFAEIFAGNCQALGIPTVTTDHETIEHLMRRVEEDPELEILIDVEAQVVRLGEESHSVEVGRSQKEALLQGNWDTTALMKSSLDRVKATYDRLPYTQGFREEKTPAGPA